MSTQYLDGLAVEVDGEGPAVVCVHGLGGSSNNWTPVMRAMGGHRVVRPDLPGSARSGSVSGELSIQRYVDSVLAVCARLEIGSAHFVGHSLGTIVCQHLAVQRPHMVKSLALFGPLACPPEAARPNIRARAAKAAEGTVAMQGIADAIVNGALSAHTRETQPAVMALVRESVMRQDPLGYSRSCEALASAASANLEEITVPVLLVTGDEDGVAPPSHVREMAARLRDAQVDVLGRCGHWTTFERPMECAQLLGAFLARR